MFGAGIVDDPVHHLLRNAIPKSACNSLNGPSIIQDGTEWKLIVIDNAFTPASSLCLDSLSAGPLKMEVNSDPDAH